MRDHIVASKRKYVAEFVNHILGGDGFIPTLPPEMETYIFYELSREEELTVRTRDTWGNWDWSFGESHRRGELYIPHVDFQLQSWLSSVIPGKWAARSRARWPEGKRFALCLSHDVDCVSRWAVSVYDFVECLQRISRAPRDRVAIAARALRLAAKGTLNLFRIWKNQPDDYWDCYRWLALENSYGFKSTFFFFAGQLPIPHKYDTCYDHRSKIVFKGENVTVSKMMQEIYNSGWEVGLHGSYQSAVSADALREEKEQVERSLGHPIMSIRNHFLHYDSMKTPRIQAEAGFKVDSTQGYNRSIGFRAGTCFPYYCWDHKAHEPIAILEVAQNIMDGALFLPNSLDYDCNLAVRHVLELMNVVSDVGGCLTLNWHSNYLNNSDYWDSYVTILSEAKKLNAWGCSAKDLYYLWTKEEDTD